MDIFFREEDRETYLSLMRTQCVRYGVEVLSYCLMTNHVHFVAVPSQENSLARAVGEAHRLYTREVNFREGERGHLFQERFFSCPMDESHFVAAIRYIERNPVRACMVKSPEDYSWSSARYHLDGRRSDRLVQTRSPFGLSLCWSELLASDPSQVDAIRLQTRTGRPLGGESLVIKAERLTGRILRKCKPGPKKEAGKDR
jgi:putative transposase